MRLIRILTEMQYDPDFEEAIDTIKKAGGKYIGSGDYGSAYLLDGKVYKITSDELELDHVEILKGKKTRNFAEIYSVRRLTPKLGIIKMELLQPFRGDQVPEEFIRRVEREARRFGIDPEELDIRKSNVMQRADGNLKLVDI